jgi:predicted unusual protein kinase regulating ubiquinone biosynthesis (AarF/ABC1/UbiB family)
MQSTKPEERVRLVYYDFGQATKLQSNQADGILDIIEAIVDMDVDKSMLSFQKMGVLKDSADMNAVREKIADNYRTGKVKANRKRLVKRNYQFKPAESMDPTMSANSTSSSIGSSTSSAGNDALVMQAFTLPAEYAFVGRALSQMNGVGKTLDSDFDFISAAAPYIVEIKGTKKYVQDEIQKWLSNLGDNIRRILPPGYRQKV